MGTPRGARQLHDPQGCERRRSRPIAGGDVPTRRSLSPPVPRSCRFLTPCPRRGGASLGVRHRRRLSRPSPRSRRGREHDPFLSAVTHGSSRGAGVYFGVLEWRGRSVRLGVKVSDRVFGAAPLPLRKLAERPWGGLGGRHATTLVSSLMPLVAALRAAARTSRFGPDRARSVPHRRGATPPRWFGDALYHSGSVRSRRPEPWTPRRTRPSTVDFDSDRPVQHGPFTTPTRRTARNRAFVMPAVREGSFRIARPESTQNKAMAEDFSRFRMVRPPRMADRVRFFGLAPRDRRHRLR